MTCSIPDCESPVRNKLTGLCSAHYQRKLTYGSPYGKPAPRAALSDWDLVRRRLERTEDRCLIFTGASGRDGYAMVRNRKVHRIAYEAQVGPIPEGMQVDHECHNAALERGDCEPGPCRHRVCCEPTHLVARTPGDNGRRGGGIAGENSRKTRCPNGHEYDLFRPGRARACKQCELDQTREAQRHILKTCPDCGKVMRASILKRHRAGKRHVSQYTFFDEGKS